MKLGKYTTKLGIFDLIYSWLRGRLLIIDLGQGPELRKAHWKSGFEVTDEMIGGLRPDTIIIDEAGPIDWEALGKLVDKKHNAEIFPIPPHYPLLARSEMERKKLNERISAHTIADYQSVKGGEKP